VRCPRQYQGVVAVFLDKPRHPPHRASAPIKVGAMQRMHRSAAGFVASIA
jgi:hypothetical protein